MDILQAGRIPRLVDDNDQDLDSSRIDSISAEELSQMLDEDSPTGEMQSISDEKE